MSELDIIYVFKNKKYLDIILSHPSYKKNDRFQVLEFLGDRILNYEITKMIFDLESTAEELSLKLSEMTSNKTLAKIGSFLTKFIRQKGGLKEKMISDCLEAFIGAMYLDGGHVTDFITNNWKDYFGYMCSQNPKNKAQELSHTLKEELKYDIIEDKKGFIAVAKLKDMIVSANGLSKKEATMKAAEKLLEMYEEVPRKKKKSKKTPNT
jgi:dsRNA-specific ribonuclease